MSKPWLEDWRYECWRGFKFEHCVFDNISPQAAGGFYGDRAEEQAKLAAAAPALVRALLLVEHRGDWGDFGPACAECGGERSTHAGHDADCVVDAALTAAGLPTQQERDAAREEIAAPEQWTQNANARLADGTPVPSTHPSAVCWCVRGALRAVSKSGNEYDYYRALCAMRGPIVAFNDDPKTTHADILREFDAAIARLT